MTTFLRVSLYVFAACTVLGILPAAMLAAKARTPVMAVFAVVVAAFVVFVLIAAAGQLLDRGNCPPGPPRQTGGRSHDPVGGGA